MPTCYFYTPDGSTIVLKVHAVTSCIQVQCHLSLRHVTSLAAAYRLWFGQALASVLVPAEQNNVAALRSSFHIISTSFLFTLQLIHSSYSFSFSILLQKCFNGNILIFLVQGGVLEKYGAFMFKIGVIRVRCCRLYGRGIPEIPKYTGCSTWRHNAKACNPIIQYLLFDFSRNMDQKDEC